MDDILTVLDLIAADSQKVKYRSDVQCALLRAAGEIKKLRGRVMMLEADVFLARIREDSTEQRGTDGG
jgi:hypothetical protein